MREWELWQAHNWFTHAGIAGQEVTRAARIALPSECVMCAVVALTDCTAPRWVPGFSMPDHYPARGFMVDLEVQADTSKVPHFLGMVCQTIDLKSYAPIAPLLHKERWFKTLAEAEGCAALFMWALDGCSDAQLIALALEHNGRMT